MNVNEEDLERILAGPPEIEPSADFAASVMRAVHAAAQAPRPIPFPWKWAIPGMAGALAAAFGAAAEAIRLSPGWSRLPLSMSAEAISFVGALGGILAGAVVTLAAVRLSTRIFRPRIA